MAWLPRSHGLSLASPRSANDEGQCHKNAAPTVPVLPSQRDWEQLPLYRLAAPTQLPMLRPSWAADPGERHLAQGQPSSQGRPEHGCHS